MITEEEYNKALQIVLKYQRQIAMDNKELDSPNTLLNDVDMSMRLYTLIRRHLVKTSFDTTPVSALSDFSISEFSRCRSVGKAALQEIDFICKKHGVEMKP